MIRYVRTTWFGFHYFFHLTGSLIPRCLPFMLFSGSIALLLQLQVLNDVIGWDLNTFFSDPYSMQLFGLVFGYLAIQRMTTCYNRYWEGTQAIKTMYGKFTCAASLIFNFDRLDDPALTLQADPFCLHINHLLVQLSMVALLMLHTGEPTQEDWDALVLTGGSDSKQPAVEGGLRESSCKFTAPAPESNEGTKRRATISMNALRRPPSTTNRLTGGMGATDEWFQTEVKHGAGRKRGSVMPRRRSEDFSSSTLNGLYSGENSGSGPAGILRNARKNSFVTGEAFRRVSTEQQRAAVRKVLRTNLRTAFSPEELRALQASKCPVTHVYHRLVRSITTRSRATGFKMPAPCVAQVYQTLSEGLIAYFSAVKIKEVPVPFAFVQLNAILLLAFNILCPIAVACFSSTISMAVITTVVVVGSFCAMWLVANEMEDPFGTEANHLDLRLFHAQFAGSLKDMLALSPEDTWIVSSGPWQDVPSDMMANGHIDFAPSFSKAKCETVCRAVIAEAFARTSPSADTRARERAEEREEMRGSPTRDGDKEPAPRVSRASSSLSQQRRKPRPKRTVAASRVHATPSGGEIAATPAGAPIVARVNFGDAPAIALPPAVALATDADATEVAEDVSTVAATPPVEALAAAPVATPSTTVVNGGLSA